MNKPALDPTRTALLIVDPYNDAEELLTGLAGSAGVEVSSSSPANDC